MAPRRENLAATSSAQRFSNASSSLWQLWPARMLLTRRDRHYATRTISGWSTLSLVLVALFAICLSCLFLVALWAPASSSSQSAHSALHEDYTRQNYILRQQIDTANKEIFDYKLKLERAAEGQQVKDCPPAADAGAPPAAIAARDESVKAAQPALVSAATDGASAAACTLGMDAAFAEFVALHKAILRGDPGVERKFIVAHPQAQVPNLDEIAQTHSSPPRR
jgi:hypothetical protein